MKGLPQVKNQHIPYHHKGSLTTIDEEMFREDPITFRVFCWSYSLTASGVLFLVTILDLIYLALQLIHLIWL
jgi:hypothetical protein